MLKLVYAVLAKYFILVLVEKEGKARQNPSRNHKSASDVALKITQKRQWADIEVYKFVRERFYRQLAEVRSHRQGTGKTITGSCRKPNNTDMSPLEYARAVVDMLKGWGKWAKHGLWNRMYM